MMKLLVVLSVFLLAANCTYFIEQVTINATDCSGGSDYETVLIPMNKCVLLQANSFYYEFINETIVNSTYKIINEYYCIGENSCPSACQLSGSVVEGCEDFGGNSGESVSYGTTESNILEGILIISAYGADSTCSNENLQEAESIGSSFAFGNGVCVGGENFDCSGNDINLYICSSGDCTSGCTLNATIPKGSCWNDIFSLGNYFRLSCGSFDITNGTVPVTTTTTGPAQTPQQVCDASNVADWSYGSGYYCYNGGFVQCWGSGSAAIACPAGTSCQCAPGVECSNHGMSSPCTF